MYFWTIIRQSIYLDNHSQFELCSVRCCSVWPVTRWFPRNRLIAGPWSFQLCLVRRSPDQHAKTIEIASIPRPAKSNHNEGYITLPIFHLAPTENTQCVCLALLHLCHSHACRTTVESIDDEKERERERARETLRNKLGEPEEILPKTTLVDTVAHPNGSEVVTWTGIFLILDLSGTLWTHSKHTHT